MRERKPRMLHAILYEDGKVYGLYTTMKSAERFLQEAIDYMDGVNWCGLHIVKDYCENYSGMNKTLDEI